MRKPPCIPPSRSIRYVGRGEDGDPQFDPVSFAPPVCSACGGRTQKNSDGEWFCLSCGDDWLKEYVDSKTRGNSIGGVALPVGIRDDRRATPSFRDLMPNRKARRAMRHG